jgi:pseudomonalisin
MKVSATPGYLLLCLAVTLALLRSGLAQSQTPSSAGSVLAARTLPNVPREDLGRRAPDKEVEIIITLAFNNEDKLDQLIQEQSNPASPSFRHFLTRQEFSESFGPTPGQVATLRSNLEAAGFRVKDIAPTQLMIRAVAPSAVVERYFQTEMHTVNQAGYGERYVNVRPAVLPPPLASIVKSVRLNNLFVGFHPTVHRKPMPAVTQAAARASSRTAEGSVPLSASAMTAKRPSALTGPFYDSGGAIGPPLIAKAFDFPVQHGYDAYALDVAVIMGSDVSDSDLWSFFSKYQIPRRGSVWRIPVNGAVIGQVDPQIGLESALDVETIGSLAPGSNVVLFIIPNDGNGNMSDADIDTAMQWVNWSNSCAVVNLSLGGQEYSDVTFWAAAKQATAQGITICVSSGDAGDVESPATDPYVVAVGGTHMTPYPNGTIYGDSVWNEGPGYVTGGGVSSIYYRPAFQSGTAGLASNVHRNVPDVAFVAQNASVWFQGNFESNKGYEIDGTSWAAPQFAALMIEAVQARGQRLGLVNQQIYSGFRWSGNRFIRDIVFGGNGHYNAKAGYDNCTGVGSPMGMSFVWYGL